MLENNKGTNKVNSERGETSLVKISNNYTVVWMTIGYKL